MAPRTLAADDFPRPGFLDRSFFFSLLASGAASLLPSVGQTSGARLPVRRTRGADRRPGTHRSGGRASGASPAATVPPAGRHSNAIPPRQSARNRCTPRISSCQFARCPLDLYLYTRRVPSECASQCVPRYPPASVRVCVCACWRACVRACVYGGRESQSSRSSWPAHDRVSVCSGTETQAHSYIHIDINILTHTHTLRARHTHTVSQLASVGRGSERRVARAVDWQRAPATMGSSWCALSRQLLLIRRRRVVDALSV